MLLIWAGIKLRHEIEGEWALMPLGLVWAVAAWAIVAGVLKIVLAFTARRFAAAAQPSAA